MIKRKISKCENCNTPVFKNIEIDFKNNIVQVVCVGCSYVIHAIPKNKEEIEVIIEPVKDSIDDIIRIAKTKILNFVEHELDLVRLTFIRTIDKEVSDDD